jgi:hypothetical protein
MIMPGVRIHSAAGLVLQSQVHLISTFGGNDITWK